MKRLHRDAKGMLLVTVIVVAGVLIALASALWMHGLTRSKASTALLDGERAVTFADGGTEIAARAVLDALADYGTIPSDGNFSSGTQSGTYTVTEIGGPWISTDPVGLNVLNQQYEIASTVTVDGIPSTVTTIITAEAIPVFQFLAFYNGDLEMLPGPTMNLSGRIHTNQDLYIGTESGATLTLNTQYVKSAEKMYRFRKNNGATMAGTVKGQVYGTSSYVNWNNGVDSTSPTWANDAITNWGGTIQSDVHGVEPLSVPTVPSVAIDGYFHQEAGLVIIDGQAYNGYGGANITGSLPAGTLTTQNVYDAREGATVATTKVDVAKLNASGYFPSNGLLYAARTDATVSNPTAIQLVNASTLNAGLTVASQNPVYIKGDYNTVAKKPASVIADAVNLLSNAWANTKTPANGLPAASSTSYNLAMISGIVPTPDGGGNYSGGFENYPRFHENWTGKTCTIRGSFVQLWDSVYAKDPWVYGGNKYTAPARNWDYDAMFDDPDTLPPFTPKSTRVQRVAWDSE